MRRAACSNSASHSANRDALSAFRARRSARRAKAAAASPSNARTMIEAASSAASKGLRCYGRALVLLKLALGLLLRKLPRPLAQIAPKPTIFCMRGRPVAY